MNAPRLVAGPAGEELDLESLAAEVCERYYEEYADEDARYGDAGRAWCRHDNQHLLNWAALSVDGLVDLDHEVTWLAGILERRGFPLDRLAHDLDLCAAVTRDHVRDGETMAVNLEGAATMVRDKGTFA